MAARMKALPPPVVRFAPGSRVSLAQMWGRGPRGLPGVNAVPADEAVGTYLETEESESRAGARAAVAADVATPGNPIHSALTEQMGAEVERDGSPLRTALNNAIADVAMMPATGTRLPDSLLPHAVPSTTSLEWAALSPARPIWPLSISIDGGMYAAYRPDHKVWRTYDGGATVEVHANRIPEGYKGAIRWVGRVKEGYGVLTGNETGGEFWLTNGWPSGTWTKTKDFGPIGNLSRPNPVWTPDGTVLIVGEYINNVFPSSSLQSWGSFDGGQTWKLLRNSLVNNDTVNSHWHAAHYDPKRRRIWLSSGDGPNAWFGYSDDHGTTWVPCPTPFTDPLSNGVNPYQQPTLLVVHEDRLVLGPDRGPAKAGICIGDAENGWTEQRYVLPGDLAAHLQYPMGSPRPAREMYIALSDEGGAGSRLTYIVGTGDGGVSWHLLSTLDCNPAGHARDWLVGPDRHGWLYIRVTDHPVHGSTMIRAKAPTWTWVRD